MKRLIQNLFQSTNKSATHTHRKRRKTFHIECLEDRQMMAADMAFVPELVDDVQNNVAAEVAFLHNAVPSSGVVKEVSPDRLTFAGGGYLKQTSPSDADGLTSAGYLKQTNPSDADGLTSASYLKQTNPSLASK